MKSRKSGRKSSTGAAEKDAPREEQRPVAATDAVEESSEPLFWIDTETNNGALPFAQPSAGKPPLDTMCISGTGTRLSRFSTALIFHIYCNWPIFAHRGGRNTSGDASREEKEGQVGISGTGQGQGEDAGGGAA